MTAFDNIKLFQTMAGAAHGGAEVFFERLAGAFEIAGISQRLAIKPHGGRKARLEALGITASAYSFSPMTAPLTKWRLAKDMRSSDSNIVLSWMNRATAMTPAIGIPHVARLGGFYNLKYYKGCDWLVANTLDIADYLIAEGWPADKVHYQINFVPDGRDGPIFDKTAVEGASSGSPIIVALGRLHNNKAFDCLIRSFASLEAGSLWLAGDGPEAQALRLLATELGVAKRVHFLGWQSDPQSIIRAADIFVCPSRHEPFGNVIAEAMACGKPIVATATNGARQLIENETNGLLTPIDDDAALANAISTLIDQPNTAKTLANAGRKTWQNTLSPAKVTKEWGQFLAQVAG